MERVRSMAVSAATPPGERDAAIAGFIRVLKTYARQKNSDFSRIQPLALEILACLAGEQDRCFSFRADLEKISPLILQKPVQPVSLHASLVGRWVYHLKRRQVARIEARFPERNGQNGPEARFLMEDRIGNCVDRVWGQYDIRLATDQEISAEKTRREVEEARQRQEEERVRSEVDDRIMAFRTRIDEMAQIRGDWYLVSIARILMDRESKLLGQAEKISAGNYVVFEASKEAILRYRCFNSSSEAAIYMTRLLDNSPSYTKLDRKSGDFDRLIADLAQI